MYVPTLLQEISNFFVYIYVNYVFYMLPSSSQFLYGTAFMSQLMFSFLLCVVIFRRCHGRPIKKYVVLTFLVLVLALMLDYDSQQTLVKMKPKIRIKPKTTTITSSFDYVADTVHDVGRKIDAFANTVGDHASDIASEAKVKLVRLNLIARNYTNEALVFANIYKKEEPYALWFKRAAKYVRLWDYNLDPTYAWNDEISRFFDYTITFVRSFYFKVLNYGFSSFKDAVTFLQTYPSFTSYYLVHFWRYGFTSFLLCMTISKIALWNVTPTVFLIQLVSYWLSVFFCSTGLDFMSLINLVSCSIAFLSKKKLFLKYDSYHFYLFILTVIFSDYYNGMTWTFIVGNIMSSSSIGHINFKNYNTFQYMLVSIGYTLFSGSFMLRSMVAAVIKTEFSIFDLTFNAVLIFSIYSQFIKKTRVHG
jgi:hypothetical protein